ncbi:axin-1-like, partial [Mizuhopecten yessoensis]
RTQRAPKDSNIAEVNPKKFAALLMEKLERVLKEREKEEKLHASMSRILESDLEEVDRSMLNRTVDRSVDRLERLDRSIDRSIDRSMDRSIDRLDRSLDRSAMLRNTSSATSMPLMTSAVIMDDDNPNSILEDHVSRIWESSAQQTPTRSPGQQSPSLKRSAADRKSSANPNQTMPLPNTLPSAVHNKSFHKKRPDYHSSFDSGMGEEKPNVETHRHIHHHHHHHHSRDPKSKTYIEIEAQQHVSCWPGDANSSARGQGSGNSETTDRGRTTRRANRKHSDTSSNIDSGISMIESISPMAVPNAMDPSTEK